MLSTAVFDSFYRFEIVEIKDAPNPAVGTLLLQQQVIGSETCSFMQPDCPDSGTCSFVQSHVRSSRIRNGTAARPVSKHLDGSQVDKHEARDASKSSPSETSESCTFLARRGWLAEHVPNREWLVLHWFYNVF